MELWIITNRAEQRERRNGKYCPSYILPRSLQYCLSNIPHRFPQFLGRYIENCIERRSKRSRKEEIEGMGSIVRVRVRVQK